MSYEIIEKSLVSDIIMAGLFACTHYIILFALPPNIFIPNIQTGNIKCHPTVLISCY